MPRLHDVRCPNCGWTQKDMVIKNLERFPICPACHEAELEADYSNWEYPPNMGMWRIWAETVWKEVDPGDVKNRVKGNSMVYYRSEEGNA